MTLPGVISHGQKIIILFVFGRRIIHIHIVHLLIVSGAFSSFRCCVQHDFYKTIEKRKIAGTFACRVRINFFPPPLCIDRAFDTLLAASSDKFKSIPGVWCSYVVFFSEGFLTQMSKKLINLSWKPGKFVNKQ